MQIIWNKMSAVLGYADSITQIEIICFHFIFVGGFVFFFFIQVLWEQIWEYFESLSHPQKEEMTKRQDIIINADDLYLGTWQLQALCHFCLDDLSCFFRPCASPQWHAEWSRQCARRPPICWDQQAALSHHWWWQPTAVTAMLHLQPKPEIQLRPWISPFSTQHSAVYDVRKPCFAIIFIS